MPVKKSLIFFSMLLSWRASHALPLSFEENTEYQRVIEFLESEANLWNKKKMFEVMFDKDKKEFFSARDQEGRSFLEFSIEYKSLPFTRFFLQQGADPYTKNGKGEYLFYVIVKEGNPRYLEPFLEAGVDSNKTDSKGNTLLYYLVERILEKSISKEDRASLREGIQVLLKYKADPYKPNKKGKSPYTLAKEASDARIVSLLLDPKYIEDPKVVKKNDLQELINDVKSNKSLKSLKDLDLNERDQEGRAVVHIFSQKGDADAVLRLFKAGADVEAIDDKGNTALHKAAPLDRTQMIELLVVELGLDVNATNNKGETPLHLASLNSGVESVKKLIDLGANLNAKDLEGNFPLHKAVLWNDQKVIDLLVTPENLNALNNKGETPLHLAIKGAGKEAVIILIEEKKADLTVLDAENRTPLEFSQELLEKNPNSRTMNEIAQYLEIKEAEMNCKTGVGS